MGIGMSCAGVNLNRLPGWERNSYGYHADDGCVYCSSATGQSYATTFTTGDVVGCGLNLVSRSIFFTKNGMNLGTATSDLPVRDPGVLRVWGCLGGPELLRVWGCLGGPELLRVSFERVCAAILRRFCTEVL